VRAVLLVAACALCALLPAAGRAARATTPSVPVLTIDTDQPAGPPLMGLGVELDPYDSYVPTATDWARTEQRLDFMRPSVLRVVEPASDYFGGYDASGNPTYKWTSKHVIELMTILGYAQSRGIPVILGDWGNPLIGGDARIPAGFISALRNTYGFTEIRYYNITNEPNNAGASCEFSCWEATVKTLAAEFAQDGLATQVQLIGPDNANSWDDTPSAQSLDYSAGLDNDNPLGGDAWVTDTLNTIPNLIGVYDSHRYATIEGIENGVYGDQVRTRREQISNVDSPAKPYFAAEVGLTARQTSPFTAGDHTRMTRALASALDPSSTFHANATPFIDSQPHIDQFNYGVWMGDMIVQALGAGLAGASAWDLDDAMHTGGEYGSQNLKQWGFWNTLGGQDGYPASDLSLRPWYYAWSVLSRSFPAGAQALVVPSTGVYGLRAAAATIPQGGGDLLSLAVVNDSDTPRSLTLTVPSATTPVTMARYDYFATDQPADVNGFPVPAASSTVVPAAGVTVQLPSRGLVVLTSLGFGSPIALNQGATTLLDDLTGWGGVAARSRRLKLDTSDPGAFDDDGSRAEAVGSHEQYLIYRAPQMTSFELKAYYKRALNLSALGSADGITWTPIELASTDPAPVLAGGRYLDELLPAAALPAGTNELKLEFGGNTEIGQARIEAGRPGPACVPAGLGAATEEIGSAALRNSRRTILGLYGTPSLRGPRTWRYCVTGGGQLVLQYATQGGAALIGSSAPGYRRRGIGVGSTVASITRRFGAAAVQTIGRRVLLANGSVVFVVAGGRVQAVAIATPALLARPRSLARAVKRAALS
jgi:hypothetical protein